MHSLCHQQHKIWLTFSPLLLKLFILQIYSLLHTNKWLVAFYNFYIWHCFILAASDSCLGHDPPVDIHCSKIFNRREIAFNECILCKIISENPYPDITTNWKSHEKVTQTYLAVFYFRALCYSVIALILPLHLPYTGSLDI